jgi:hypothetical protein
MDIRSADHHPLNDQGAAVPFRPIPITGAPSHGAFLFNRFRWVSDSVKLPRENKYGAQPLPAARPSDLEVELLLPDQIEQTPEMAEEGRLEGSACARAKVL